MAMMKKLTSAIVASSLVLSVVGVAAAATPDQENAAAARMQTLGLVQGKGGSDLALGDPITRAELVTIIVRAFGQENSANYLKGVAAFSDTADHWASGYIAMADQLIKTRTNGKEVVGYPDGTFKPDQQVTTAEAVAFLMKFTGAPADNTLSWPDNYLQGAVNAGIISAEDLASLESIKNVPADRGLAFYLADSAFSGYKLAEGNTVYRTFVDNQAPELTITTQAPAPTLDSKITITGTVANAESVFVGTPDHAATINNGTYSIDVDLAMGENNITVTAVDLVGNTTERTLKVTRTTGPAVGIQAEDITVAAGETVDVAAAVVDEAGNALADQVITGESTVGTYADGKFTAGTTAGEGTLTLKSGDFTKEVKVTITPAALSTVKAARPFAAGEAVQLVGVDAYGNVIPGVTFAEAQDSANAFINGDKLIVTKNGSYEITGTLGDVVVTGTVAPYGDVDNIAVSADKDELVANGSSTITVTVKAVDANGNVVPDFNGYARYEGDLVVDDDKDYLWTDDDSETAVVELENGTATFVLRTVDTDLAGDDAEMTFGIYEEYSDAEDGDDVVAETDYSVPVVDQVATSLYLDDVPDYLPVNIDPDEFETTVTVKVLDQDGEEMLDDDNYDFDVKVEGPAYVIDEDGDESKTAEFENVSLYKDSADPDRILTITPKDDDETGTVTITVTSDDLKSAMATIQAAIAGNAKGIQIDSDDDTVTVDDATSEHLAEYGKYDLQLVDRKGVPTDNDDKGKVTVNVKGADHIGDIYYVKVDADTPKADPSNPDDWKPLMSDSFDVVPNEEDGSATFWLASKVAGNISIWAEDGDEDDDVDLKNSNTFDVTFEAGKPATVAFVGFYDYNTPQVNLKTEKTAKLVAQLYDAYGNAVAKSGYTVTAAVNDQDNDQDHEDLIKVNGKDGSDIDDLDLTTDRNGQVVLNIELDEDLESTDTISLSLDVEGIGGTTDTEDTTVTLAPTKDVAKKLDVKVFEGGSKATSVKPGQSYTLQLTGKDDDDEALANFGVVRITSSAAMKWGSESEAVPVPVHFVPASTPLQEGKLIVKFTVPDDLPDDLDVSRITFKAELVSYANVISDSVSVKLNTKDTSSDPGNTTGGNTDDGDNTTGGTSN